MTAPITIDDYGPSWPAQFQTLRARIAAALDGLATAIEHVGSTAVPGLAAKPILDIDVLSRSAADLPLAVTKLASLGYEHQGDLGISGREAFRTPRYVFPHRLYVCLAGSQEFQRHIAFRDYLRTHPQEANACATLKQKLAGKSATDREAYTLAKTEFVEAILRRAGQDKTFHANK